ncbi:hypothetical protein OTU49_010678, partial [Cherax quadricarinatus]
TNPEACNAQLHAPNILNTAKRLHVEPAVTTFPIARRKRRHVQQAVITPATNYYYTSSLRKARFKRSQSSESVQRAVGPPELLMVSGEVVLRKTDEYDSDSNDQLQEAIIAVLSNTTIAEKLDLDVVDVVVDDLESKLCDSGVNCTNTYASCIDEWDTALNVSEGRCRCKQSYVDLSPNNETNPGEICVMPCSPSFCYKGGQCELDNIYFTRSCSCNEWYYKGQKCSTDLRAVIGSVVSVLIIAVVLVGALIIYRRRSRNWNLDEGSPAYPDSEIDGVYNGGYWTLSRNTELMYESFEEISHETPTDVALTIPRPIIGRQIPRDVLQDPEIRLTRARSDPGHPDWHTCQNIPRPRLSL